MRISFSKNHQLLFSGHGHHHHHAGGRGGHHHGSGGGKHGSSGGAAGGVSRIFRNKIIFYFVQIEISRG